MTVEGFLKYPAIFGCAFLVTFLLVPLIRSAALRLGIVDKPSSRRINTVPVPRGGGLAIFAGVQTAALIIFLFPWEQTFRSTLDTTWWQSFLAASSILFVTGLIDDRYDLRWSVKLVMQAVAAVTMLSHGFSVGQLGGYELPLAIDCIATILWYLALTNAFNLIDGLDGLATGLAAIASIGLAGAAMIRGTPGDALFLIAMFGACLAFLRFNFNPASIFLGDSGSMFLGFSLAAIALTSVTKTSTVAALGAPLLAAGVPLFDTMLAVWRRSVRMLGSSGTSGSNPGSTGIAKPDLDHLHHRLLRSGLSQKKVALWLYAFNALLVSTGLLSLVFSTQARGIYLVAFVLGTYVAIRHLAKVELWDSGKAIMRGLKRPPRSLLISSLCPAFDFLALSAALGLAIASAPLTMALPPRRAWMELLPLWCGISFIILAFAGVYNRVWSRSSISDHISIIACLAAGTALASGASMLMIGRGFTVSPAFALVFFSVSALLINGLRAVPEAVRDVMTRIDNPECGTNPPLQKALLYGAGYKAMLYLKYRSFKGGLAESGRIAGFIDDDISLKNRKVYGYKVLGEIKDLPQLVNNSGVTHVIVTSSLLPENRARLIKFCSANSIKVTDWAVEEKVAAGY